MIQLPTKPEMGQAGPGSLEVYLLQKTGSGKTYSSNHIEDRCLCRRTCKSLGKEERIWGNLPGVSDTPVQGKQSPYLMAGEAAFTLGGLGIRSTEIIAGEGLGTAILAVPSDIRT